MAVYGFYFLAAFIVVVPQPGQISSSEMRKKFLNAEPSCAEALSQKISEWCASDEKT
jgi:hypothetical protein